MGCYRFLFKLRTVDESDKQDLPKYKPDTPAIIFYKGETDSCFLNANRHPEDFRKKIKISPRVQK